MVYRRYRPRYQKKRPYKRRYKGKSITNYQAITKLGGTALALLKSKLGLNTETHWLDTVETNVATSSTCGTMAYALSIPVDDTVNGRNGSKVRLTSYTCNGRINADTAATTGCLVRVFFVNFYNTRGSSPSAAAFLDSNTRITSPYNMGDAVSSTGYKVLYDRTFKIAPPGNEGDRATFSFTYKPLRHMLEWTTANTDGIDSAMQTGYIRGFIMTDETGANTADYWANHRIKFVDN